jgi:hypothetical protein
MDYWLNEKMIIEINDEKARWDDHETIPPSGSVPKPIQRHLQPGIILDFV